MIYSSNFILGFLVGAFYDDLGKATQLLERIENVDIILKVE